MEYLTANLDAIFKSLERDQYLENMDFDDFIVAIAKYYGDLIVLHPFGEGNGRTTRTLLAMLTESVGWDISWADMDPEHNIEASIASYNGDNTQLELMFKTMVIQLDPFWRNGPNFS